MKSELNYIDNNVIIKMNFLNIVQTSSKLYYLQNVL